MVTGIVTARPDKAISLPAAQTASPRALEAALQQRRSVRSFGTEPLALAEIAQILWAAQGVTNVDGLRTAPSAGALYPLGLYLAVARVEGMAPGIYKYLPAAHCLRPTYAGTCLAAISEAAWDQTFIAHAAAALIFTADHMRTVAKYGERGMRYIYMEMGHAAQNALLQAATLGLNAVPVGAFDDDQLQDCVHVDPTERTRYLVVIGRKAL